MLAHFPAPYPDELLYSICARYSDHVQYLDYKAINSELFGFRNITSIIDLPCYLNKLSARLPAKFTPSYFINSHTLLGCYRPFLPTERVARIHSAMADDGAALIHKYTGIINTIIRRPDWLRFCPACALEDRRQFGETYWHRAHQATAALVCSTHHVFLENSCVRARNRANEYSYVHAELEIGSLQPQPLDLTDYCHQTLLDLTRDVVWLLNQHNLAPGFKAIRDCYLRLLAEQGLSSPRGCIRTKQLIRSFRNFYSAGLLKLLQCDFNELSASNWLSLIIKQLNTGQVNHSTRHLLLIHFLGHSAESFFELCSQKPVAAAKPFGSGPWPCLNPVCNHYRKPKIRTYETIYSYANSPALVGIFRCACGFTYARHADSQSAKDRFTYAYVRHYGPVWEAELKMLWRVSSISVTQMAKQLSVSRFTIKERAIRLGLSFPRVGPGSHPAVADPLETERLRQQHFKQSSEYNNQQLKLHRRAWLLARKNHPDATRSKLRIEIASRTYKWLYNHDRKWLEAHKPPPRRSRNPSRRLDLAVLDVQLSDKVQRADLKIRDDRAFPRRVTKAEIAREIDQVTKITAQWLRRLPLTSDAISQAIETRLEFDIRCVHWAANRFLQEKVAPTLLEFVARVQISLNNLYTRPKLKAVLYVVWQSLQEMLTTDLTAAA